MGTYLKRLAERVVVAFVAGASAVLLAGDGGLDKGLLGAAIAGGVHAAYGVLVKRVGDKDRPDVA